MVWSSQVFLARVSSHPRSFSPVCGLATMAAGSSSSKRILARADTVDVDSVPVVTKEYVNRQVPGEWFSDGSLLERLAKEHAEAFSKLMRPPTSRTEYGPGARELTWASACTGSAGDVWVAKALEGVSPGTRIRQLFACESKPCKQAWIAAVHEAAAPGMDICVFDDIANLGGRTCNCVTHSKKKAPVSCKVPYADVFVCCTSCKDMSRVHGGPPPLVLAQRKQSWVSTDLARHARLS